MDTVKLFTLGLFAVSGLLLTAIYRSFKNDSLVTEESISFSGEAGEIAWLSADRCHRITFANAYGIFYAEEKCHQLWQRVATLEGKNQVCQHVGKVRQVVARRQALWQANT